MNYYERHIGDYLRDTAHLSLLEHGVYGRILDLYYVRDGGVPVDQVARLVGARTEDERAAVQSVVEEFFKVTGGMLQHDRCDREIASYREGDAEREQRHAHEKERMRRHREERSRLFAELREHDITPKWDTPVAQLREILERTRKAPATLPGREQGQTCNVPATACNAPATATQTPDTRHQTTTVVPVGEVVGCGEEDAVADKPRRPGSQGTRIPSDWRPSEADIAYCRDRRPELDPLEVAAAFLDFWSSKAGAAGRKVDWSATWRTWVRNERSPPVVNGKHAARKSFHDQVSAIAGGQHGHTIDVTPSAPALGRPAL